MAQEFLLATQFVTAAAMLGLAGWLLWLKFGSPVNRAFALFLILSALRIIFFRFRDLTDAPFWDAYWTTLAQYMLLAAPWVLIYFALLLLPPRNAMVWRVLTIAAGFAVVLLFLIDHCLHECAVAGGLNRLGPLSVVANVGPLTMGLVGLRLAADVVRQDRPGGQRATSLLAAALLLNAVLDGTIAWASLASMGWDAALAPWVDNFWQPVPFVVFGAGVAPGIMGLVVLMFGLRNREGAENQPGTLGPATLLAIASGIFIGAGFAGIRAEWALFLVGIWRMVLPGLAVYALLRHRLFGMDLKLKGAVRSSVIASFFGVAFFVGEEGLETFIEAPSAVLGVAMAGVIALALKPIQVLAHRVADRLLPGVRPYGELGEKERLAFYREQALLVWTDGIVGEKERRLLDHLQGQLGVSTDEAAAVEAEAAGAFHRGRSSSGS